MGFLSCATHAATCHKRFLTLHTRSSVWPALIAKAAAQLLQLHHNPDDPAAFPTPCSPGLQPHFRDRPSAPAGSPPYPSPHPPTHPSQHALAHFMWTQTHTRAHMHTVYRYRKQHTHPHTRGSSHLSWVAQSRAPRPGIMHCLAPLSAALSVHHMISNSPGNHSHRVLHRQQPVCRLRRTQPSSLISAC